MKLRNAPILLLLLTACDTGEPAPEKPSGHTIGFQGADYANAINTTLDGGYIIAGSTNSVRGNTDMLLMKTNGKFEVEWSKTLGGDFIDYAYDVTQTQDGGFAMIGTVTIKPGNTDMMIAKVNSRGEVVWSKIFGDTLKDEGRGIKETPDGDLIAVGSYTLGGNADVFFVRMDALGNVRWRNAYGNDFSDIGNAIVLSSDGGFVTAGTTSSISSNDIFLMKVSGDGRLEWMNVYPFCSREEGRGVVTTPEGGYMIVGLTNGTCGGSPPDFNAVVIKTSSAGTVQWTTFAGSTPVDEGFSIAPTSDGGCLVTGDSYENSSGSDLNLWVAKINSTGSIMWTRSYGGNSYDAGFSIVPRTGGFTVAGVTQSQGAGNSDIYLLKINGDGDVQ